MYWGIESNKDLFELISYIFTTLGFIAILYGIFAYRLSKKQLHLATMSRCISTFQTRFININSRSKKGELKEYIDFVNEQLFYMRKDYLPKEVSLEWIDGMIDFIPIKQAEQVLNEEQAIMEIITHELLKSYRRVEHAFHVRSDYDMKIIYSRKMKHRQGRAAERRKLARDIYSNIRSY